jgi:hypothetical protein
VRKPIVAVLADRAKADFLHDQGLSWAEVFERFAGNPTVNLTLQEAKAWSGNGFAEWAGRGRMLITARLEAFPRLHDLSARVGGYVATNRKEEWVGPYLRGQFIRRSRRATRVR